MLLLHAGVPSLFYMLSLLLFFRYAVQLEARSGASILLRRLDTLLSASSPEAAPDMPALDVWAAAATKAALVALARQVGTLHPETNSPKMKNNVPYRRLTCAKILCRLSWCFRLPSLGTGSWVAWCAVNSETAQQVAVVLKALLEVPDKGYGRFDVAYDIPPCMISPALPQNLIILKLKVHFGDG